MTAEITGETGMEGSKQFKVGGWGAHFVMIICSLLLILNYADRQVFASVLQPMKVELGLTDALCGLAQTIFLLGVALFSFPVAYIIDRWSRKKAIMIMAVVWSVMTALTGLAKNFAGVLIPRSLVGVGEAGFTSGGTALVTAVYKKESRSLILGIFYALGMTGLALGLMLGGWLSVKYGWRSAFFVLGIPGIIVGLFALFMKDYKTVAGSSTAGENMGIGKAIVAIFRIPTLRWFYIGYGIFYFMITTVMAWLPAYAIRTMNITEAAAGMLVGYMSLSVIIGAPLGGFLADLWQKKSSRGRIYLSVLSSFLAVIAMIIVIIIKLNTLGIVIGILYTILSMMLSPNLGSISQDVVPPEYKGISYGLAAFCAYIFGGAWGPLAVGALSDALGGGGEGLGNAIMILCGATGIIGSLIMIMAARHYAPDMEKVRHQALLAER